MGVEGSGQHIDVAVGADGPEVFNVVPEVRGGVGPVGNGWRFVIRYYDTRGQTISVFVTSPNKPCCDLLQTQTC